MWNVHTFSSNLDHVNQYYVNFCWFQNNNIKLYGKTALKIGGTHTPKYKFYCKIPFMKTGNCTASDGGKFLQQHATTQTEISRLQHQKCGC